MGVLKSAPCPRHTSERIAQSKWQFLPKSLPTAMQGDKGSLPSLYDLQPFQRLSAGDGIRTHTSFSGQGILSPLRLPVPPPPHIEGTAADKCPTILMIAKAPAPVFTQARPASMPERVYHGIGGRVRASFIRSFRSSSVQSTHKRAGLKGPGAAVSSRYFSTLEYWYFRAIESMSFRAEKREASTTNTNQGKDRNSATSDRSVRNP